MVTNRENYIRNARREGHEWIPSGIHINMASLDLYRDDLEVVLERNKDFFPNFKRGQIDYDHFDFGNAHRKDEDYVDAWGCTWRSTQNGIEGVVMKHPLEDWSAYANYKVPDPATTSDRGPRDWQAIEEYISQEKQRGGLTSGGVAHGFTFLRLQYLRGFENCVCDMADDEPMLWDLVSKIDEHNLYIVKKYLELGVDVMELPEDLGMQHSSIISPDMFRKWILPSYRKMVEPCRKSNTLVAIHSDGYIMDIVEDLIGVGMDIINPQDLCNGIDNIARTLKVKACIRLDIDRMQIIPYGTKNDIFDLIKEETMKLGSKEGGLEFIAGIYPPTPPQNVDYLCQALREYRTYWV